MARENGWEMIGEFVDEGFTAYTGNRGRAWRQQSGGEGGRPKSWPMLVAQHTSRFARGDGAKPGAPRALVELCHEWARATCAGDSLRTTGDGVVPAAAHQGEADDLESERNEHREQGHPSPRSGPRQAVRRSAAVRLPLAPRRRRSVLGPGRR